MRDRVKNKILSSTCCYEKFIGPPPDPMSLLCIKQAAIKCFCVRIALPTVMLLLKRSFMRVESRVLPRKQ